MSSPLVLVYLGNAYARDDSRYDPPMPLRSVLALLSLAFAGLRGCGDESGSAASTTSGERAATAAAVAPALARSAAARGELVFSGEGSPRSHGPLELDGRYLVRFEQIAPEDPSLDFAGQTPFTATLQRRAGEQRGAVKLFSAAARTGRRTLSLRGRYVLDVAFGDFPYAVRFTPRD